METAVTATVTPIHMIIGLVIQLILPIIIIRKLDYLINLMHEYFDRDQESSS